MMADPDRLPYEHAAPLIRMHLLQAVKDAHAARTIRERRAEFARAYAYAKVLDVMSHSDDQPDLTTTAAGIHHIEKFDARDIAHLESFLGIENYKRLIGLRLP